MKQGFYAGMAWADLPLLALFVFLGVFVAVIVRTWVYRKASAYDALAQLPFDDEVRR